MSERKIKGRDCVRLSNKIIDRCQLSVKPVSNISDIKSDFFIELLQVLCGPELPAGVKLTPTSDEDHVNNVQAIVSHLAVDVIHVDLSHISGKEVIAGDTRAIYNLLEIFCGLHKYLSKTDLVDKWHLDDSLTETEEETSGASSSSENAAVGSPAAVKPSGGSTVDAGFGRAGTPSVSAQQSRSRSPRKSTRTSPARSTPKGSVTYAGGSPTRAPRSTGHITPSADRLSPAARRATPASRTGGGTPGSQLSDDEEDLFPVSEFSLMHELTISVLSASKLKAPVSTLQAQPEPNLTPTSPKSQSNMTPTPPKSQPNLTPTPPKSQPNLTPTPPNSQPNLSSTTPKSQSDQMVVSDTSGVVLADLTASSAARSRSSDSADTEATDQQDVGSFTSTAGEVTSDQEKEEESTEEHQDPHQKRQIEPFVPRRFEFEGDNDLRLDILPGLKYSGELPIPWPEEQEEAEEEETEKEEAEEETEEEETEKKEERAATEERFEEEQRPELKEEKPKKKKKLQRRMTEEPPLLQEISTHKTSSGAEAAGELKPPAAPQKVVTVAADPAPLHPPRPGKSAPCTPAAKIAAAHRLQRRLRVCDGGSVSDPGMDRGARARQSLLTRYRDAMTETRESAGESSTMRIIRGRGGKTDSDEAARRALRTVQSAPQDKRRYYSGRGLQSGSICSEGLLRWLESKGQGDAAYGGVNKAGSDVFEFLRHEYPYVRVSEEIKQRLVKQYSREVRRIMTLSAPSQPRKQHKRQRDELRRQSLLTDIIRQRCQTVSQPNGGDMDARIAQGDAGHAGVTTRRYVNSFNHQFQAEMALNKSKEELLLKAILDETLKLQKQRLRAVRRRERQAIASFYGEDGYTSDLNRMHQFYESQFCELSILLSRERDDLRLPEPLQQRLAQRIRSEFRAYMEADVHSLNDKIVNSWQPQYRELEADRIRSDLYRPNWKFSVT